MSVTEHERHQLFTWFEEHMGQERAATMMNLVPPVGWADVATKRDLDQVETRLDGRIDQLESRLEARFDAVDARFDTTDARFEAVDARFEAVDARFDAIDGRFDATDARFDGLMAHLDARFDAHESRFEARLGEFRGDVHKTMGTWIFASQATMIAVLSLLYAIFGR